MSTGRVGLNIYFKGFNVPWKTSFRNNFSLFQLLQTMLAKCGLPLREKKIEKKMLVSFYKVYILLLEKHE